MSTYPIGADGGNGSMGTDIVGSTNLSMSGGIYYRFWLKVLPTFRWGNGTAKVKFFRQSPTGLGTLNPGGYTGYLVNDGVGVHECSGFTGDCRANDGSTDGGDNKIRARTLNGGTAYPLNSANFSDGQWHEWIVYVKPNTNSSTANAELRVYRDGTQVSNYLNWKLYSSGSLPNVDLNWGSWGVIQYWQLNDAGAGCDGAGAPCFFTDSVSADTVWNSQVCPSAPECGGSSDTTAPTAPGSPSTSAISPTWIDVSWTASTDANGIANYFVERCAGSSCVNFAQIGTTTLTTYHDTAVAPSTTYNYRIRASDPSNNLSAYSSTVSGTTPAAPNITSPEPKCPGGSAPDATWLWCDDFEDNANLSTKYFDYCSHGVPGCSDDGTFVNQASVGFGNSRGLKSTYIGNIDNTAAGHFILPIGKVPSAFTSLAGNPSTVYRELYFRAYIRTDPAWLERNDAGAKFMRLTSFVPQTGDPTGANWNQAMIAHLWDGHTSNLAVDPASCVTGSTVNCSGYNDFANLVFLGELFGATNVFSTANRDTWYCVEGHVKLNDAGQSNGREEFWVNGALEASATNLNFVGSYTTYGLNMLFIENFTNNAYSQTQSRYWDNLVVATTRIGCLGAASPPPTAPCCLLGCTGAGCTPANLGVASLVVLGLVWWAQRRRVRA